MTDEQINTAIAQACGWRKEDGVWMWTANGIDCTCPELWDWANDLKAMHEAVKTLNIYQQAAFFINLGKAVTHNLPAITASLMDYRFTHATARQRAEAFLRALGKWEEETR